MEVDPVTKEGNDVSANGIDFLPQIYDIIKGIDRENTEAIQVKRSEFQENTSQKVVDFQKKLEQSREQINKLPGIEYSKEDQLRRLDALRKQLVLKKQLLQKYKNLSSLEGVKQYVNPPS